MRRIAWQGNKEQGRRERSDRSPLWEVDTPSKVARSVRPSGLARRSRSRTPARLAREPLQLLEASRVAEHHLVSSSRKVRPKLAAHQSRTQNPYSHSASPWTAAQRSTM